MCCTIGLTNWKRGDIFQPGELVVLSKVSSETSEFKAYCQQIFVHFDANRYVGILRKNFSVLECKNVNILKLYFISDRRYHKQHKAQTIVDLKRGKLDVVVTTFETCRDNVEELNRFKWTAIIADEVHKIKVLTYYFDEYVSLHYFPD